MRILLLILLQKLTGQILVVRVCSNFKLIIVMVIMIYNITEHIVLMLSVVICIAYILAVFVSLLIHL